MDSVDLEKQTIQQCMHAIRQRTKCAFVLVGGAGGILAGSSRSTADIDILLAADVNPKRIHDELKHVDGFAVTSGVLSYRGPKTMTIDLLESIVLEKHTRIFPA